MKFRLASGESAERFTRNSVFFGAGASARPAGRRVPSVRCERKKKQKRKSKMDREPSPIKRTQLDRLGSMAGEGFKKAEKAVDAAADATLVPSARDYQATAQAQEEHTE